MTSRLLVLLSACGGGEVALPFAPDDWPSYGHDPTNSRSSGESAIGPANTGRLEEAWRFDGPGVTSTPVVVDGVVYVGGWDGRLHARRLEDGSEVWTARLAGVADSSALVTEDAVFVGDGTGELHRVDRETGQVRWSVDLDPHPAAHLYASPALAAEDDLLVIGVASIELATKQDDYTFRGSVVGIDATSGEEVWRTYVSEDDETSGAGVSVWSSCALDPARRTAYVGTGQAYEEPAGPLSDSLVAIRWDTGEIAWHVQLTPDDVFTFFGIQTGPDTDVGASPNLFTIGGRDLVGVVDKAGVYYALDRETGDPVWATELTGGSHLGGGMASTAYADGVVYVCSNAWETVGDFEDEANGSVTFALDAADGTKLWETPVAAPCFGAIAHAGGVVFHGTIDGTVLAFDARDGAVVWTDLPGEPIGGGPSVAGGLLLVPHGFTFFGVPSEVTGGLVAYRPH